MPLKGKLDPKYWKCQFKLKFGTKTESSKQTTIVMLFLVNLVQKKQSYQFKLKFGNKTNTSKQILKYHFLGKLGSKNQICKL